MIDLLVLASDFIVHTSSSGFRRAGHLSVYNLIKLGSNSFLSLRDFVETELDL